MKEDADDPSPRPPQRRHVLVEDDRTGLDIETLKRAVMDNLFYIQGRFADVATENDLYMALAYTIRDRILHRWIHTAKTYKDQAHRTVCYFSAEYLLGPHLGNNLINLGIFDRVRRAVGELGLDIDDLIEREEEPGLGNGGLGRLAACYLDSLANLEIPAIGYGIRYEFGIFDQLIKNGWQVETTDTWLRLGNPWEIRRPEVCFDIPFGGSTEASVDGDGRYRVTWIPNQIIKGVAYDTPITGHDVNTANLLRLWKSEASESFDLQAFNVGDYYGAVQEKVVSENITKILYPNDELLQGKTLRLKQQYFFVSCSLQDMIRIHLQSASDLTNLHEKYAVQLNDTHPAIAVAELMRILVDIHAMDWDEAWEITQNTFGFTNHTLLPEALETWPVSMFGVLLPRHLELIFEINRRFLDDVSRRYPGDTDRLRRLSIIDESGERSVRMAHLACVGSHAINGVAELHSRLLKERVLRDFNDLWPKKFSNKTNGVTPRRWIVLSNPSLAELITSTIGDRWIRHLEALRDIEPFADDEGFRQAWRDVKRTNKTKLARIIAQRTGVSVDPDSLFDIQVKRIHEYKRQHLNVLHIVTLYQALKQDPNLDIPPRTFIFGGKAAPGYAMAKLIIKLITSVGDVINNDPDIRDRLKVVFLPDFCVKLAQRIYPAADLSEQISTAGMEASGTGNMKFAMNGALTIGTFDGANIEIREKVGPQNFFLFGLTEERIARLRQQGYAPQDWVASDPDLRRAIDHIASGTFSEGDRNLFQPLLAGLMSHDPYMLFADYRAYIACQRSVGNAFKDQDTWTRKSIRNTARMGFFSSDRAIREYCRDIWKVDSVKISL